MPVGAGEHSGWLGAGSLGSVAPGILMMKVISRNFFFFGLVVPEEGVSRFVGALNRTTRGRAGQHLCSSWDLCVRGQKPSSIATSSNVPRSS